MARKANAEATCFVIMPFGGSNKAARFHYNLVYDHVIRPAFEAAKEQYSKTAPAQEILILRIDERYVEDLKESIVDQLNDAPVVVADVSDNNPNVLFELGFRHALGKPIVCISNKPEDTVFWGGKFQVIDYTGPESGKMIADGILNGFQKVKTKTDAGLESLQTTIAKGDLNDSFQDRVAAWRLSVAKDQIKHIQSGDWTIQLRLNPAYMHHLLEGAAGLLHKGEMYRSLTNSEFWLPKIDSLLTANVEAAKKGVLVERIFMLTKTELEDAKRNPKGDLRHALNLQIDAAREAVAFTKSEQSFVVKAHIIDDNQPKYENFALLCDAGGDPSLALAPKMKDGQFTELHLDFLLGSADDVRKASRWVNILNKASSKGKPLPELLLPTAKKSRSQTT